MSQNLQFQTVIFHWKQSVFISFMYACIYVWMSQVRSIGYTFVFVIKFFAESTNNRKKQDMSNYGVI